MGSNTPHDASAFEFHRGPILLIVEGGSADVDDGAYGAIWLFSFEGGAETSGAGVAMEAQGPRRVDDRVPIRKDKYRGCSEFREKGANGILHCGGEFERSALFQEGGDASVIGANAICRDDVAQKDNTCGTSPGFIRGELAFMEA